jgi:HlyD family secretion protein
LILSAESAGRILEMNFEEGDDIKQGDAVALIDTTQMNLQKQQILAAMTAIASRRQDVQVQLNVFEEKKKNVVREKNRLENLIKDGAATQKQLDDINGEIEVLNRNILATKTGLETANTALSNELKPQIEQLKILDDKISKSKVVSPINGVIITKYAEKGELATPGKPVVKIADLENIYLKAYISGSQLSEIKLGQKLKVYIDKGNNDYYTFTGSVSWISPKAEFTPKIIQTKEERVNLVYAFKVAVKNDGKIKIGMPGEIRFR